VLIYEEKIKKYEAVTNKYDKGSSKLVRKINIRKMSSL
jgi:hypothetical protein